MFSFFAKSSQKSVEDQLKILPAPTPNPYYNNQSITPTFILLHCTAYDDPMNVWLKEHVSAHYLIPEENHSNDLIAYEVVKMPLRAWHAGVSAWQNFSGLNDYAIGIEINMPNYARALMNGSLDFLYFEPYQRTQIRALVLLVQALQNQYGIPANNIIAHADVAAFREEKNQTVLGKTDPGPTLPWRTLSELDIGQWLDESIPCPSSVSQNLSPAIAQQYLKKIGYAIEHTNVFDMKTNLTLGAFRLHFMSDCYNASSGEANQCYSEPLDANTVCTMYRLLESKKFSPNNHSTTSPWVWASLGLAGAGTLLLAYLAIRYLLKKGTCKKEYEPITEKRPGP